MTSHIMPCPFCPDEQSNPVHSFFMAVRCENCLCLGPSGDNKDEAIWRWSSRVPARKCTGTDKVKSCPWCGGTSQPVGYPKNEPREFVVRCLNVDCDAYGPGVSGDGDEAVAAWNSRAGEAARQMREAAAREDESE